MKKVLIFAILGLLVGGGSGVGAGLLLAPEEEIIAEPGSSSDETAYEEAEQGEDTVLAYANFSDQFIVPIVGENDVQGMVVLSIGIEVEEEALQSVYDKEPKLRAEFLQSLFNHANHGGFDENFTAFSAMDSLRRELRTIARNEVGRAVREVLILDIIRQ